MAALAPGELIALTSAPDREGVWHLVAQVQGEGDKVLHGTLHTNPRGDRDSVRFLARDDLRLDALGGEPPPV